MSEDDPKSRLSFLTKRLSEIKETRKLVNLYHKLPNMENDGGPYTWAAKFHNAGATHKERLLMAANRVGKTLCATAEDAIHLTGLYPPWWEGRRFNRPVEIWVGAHTADNLRDIVQEKLFGGIGRDAFGTGWIPKSHIHQDGPRMMKGVNDVVDYVRVKHESGGWSILGFKTYKQGWVTWQGTGKDMVHFDEEPPQDVYAEGMTRTLERAGLGMLTFTPLSGVTPLVRSFLDGAGGKFMINATWDDAPHLADEEKARLLEGLPKHMRDAKSKGKPMMGTGAIFGIDEGSIYWDPHPIPSYWRRIVGLDFGIGHEMAIVWIAYDADSDTIYVYDVWSESDRDSVVGAQATRKHGTWIPVAWPHDGMQRDKGSGRQLSEVFLQNGANMLAESARYAPSREETNSRGGPQPTEPVIQDILTRMQTGRFKVSRHLNRWFEQFRFYHRKDGKIVRENDDILSATFYAVMMLRYAVTQTETSRRPSKTVGGLDSRF